MAISGFLGTGDFSRSAAMEVLRAWGDKIGDRKTKEQMETLLTALLESISPGEEGLILTVCCLLHDQM